MYKILLHGITNKYELQELIKVFLSPDMFVSYTDAEAEAAADLEVKYGNGNLAAGGTQPAEIAAPAAQPILLEINQALSADKNEIKREIYRKLAAVTGYEPEWGILTGVRPVKLAGELLDRLQDMEAVRRTLREDYLLAESKIDLLTDTLAYQREVCGKAAPDSVGVYIGIPFCPTRCLYCSFTSNQVPDAEIARYLEALKQEIAYVGRRMRQTGLWAESIYIGGGTPTTLTAEQLDALLGTVEAAIDLSKLKEFTVEAGRPETITYEKLEVLQQHHIARISINPQSMHAKTLDLIGRAHRPDDIVKAFQRADWVGIPIVNADVITGLPEESPADFAETMEALLALDPENITVHTLAVKRASRLVEVDKDFHYKQGETVKEMLAVAQQKLKAAGFRPYYLYRQKHMAGAFENTGYCKGDTPCIYNIRIMEEKQTILALGAGGISKIYYPDENRLERVPNVSNYEIYISRLEEMLDRKEQNIFKEVEKRC